MLDIVEDDAIVGDGGGKERRWGKEKREKQGGARAENFSARSGLSYLANARRTDTQRKACVKMPLTRSSLPRFACGRQWSVFVRERVVYGHLPTRVVVVLRPLGECLSVEGRT